MPLGIEGERTNDDRNSKFMLRHIAFNFFASCDRSVFVAPRRLGWRAGGERRAGIDVHVESSEQIS